MPSGFDPRNRQWHVFETKADMEFFLGQLRLVLPILGFDLFRMPVTQTAGDDAVFTFSTAGATATARESDDGFVVLAGSTARKQGTDTFPLGYEALRGQLVQDGRLVDGPSPELFMFAAECGSCRRGGAARRRAIPRRWHDLRAATRGTSHRPLTTTMPCYLLVARVDLSCSRHVHHP
jgi:hypothetical protein